MTSILIATSNLSRSCYSELMRLLWQNPTNRRSLRLSLFGLKFVKTNLGLESYEFELPDSLTNRNLLQLERLMSNIYYLVNRKKIILFDDQAAVMLSLHSGDLKRYLDDLESSADSG
jgi:hypothetical protein